MRANKKIIKMPTTSATSEAQAVDPTTADVGARLLQLRQSHGMTQRELATLSGITNGAISQIEQNNVSPSVASLKKILAVFGLSLADFFSDEFDKEKQIFFRASELTVVSKGPLMLRQVGKCLHSSKLQVLHEIYAPGADTGPSMLSHEGEEAGVIVRGEVEVTVANNREVLGSGDAYYFHSKLPHRFRNRSKVECELISVCTPPTF